MTESLFRIVNQIIEKQVEATEKFVNKISTNVSIYEIPENPEGLSEDEFLKSNDLGKEEEKVERFTN